MNRFSKAASWLRFSALCLASQVISAAPASAQTVPCSSANTGFGAALNGTGGNPFAQFANFVMSGPIKYGMIAGVAAIIIWMLLDNGGLPQIVKQILGVLAAVVALTLLIAWMGAQNLCVS